jgi:protein-tyrosine phosphatase
MGKRDAVQFREQVKHLDCHEVAPDLWVGSKPFPGQYYAFDVIVLCASDYQPEAEHFPGVAVIHAPFDDTPFPTDADVTMAMRAAHTVIKHLQAGKRVLVTCWAGQNRSALVAALAMKRKWKHPTTAVVQQIQAAREHTLNNKSFVKILELW